MELALGDVASSTCPTWIHQEDLLTSGLDLWFLPSNYSLFTTRTAPPLSDFIYSLSNLSVQSLDISPVSVAAAGLLIANPQLR